MDRTPPPDHSTPKADATDLSIDRPEKATKPKVYVVPNRKELRGRGINVTRRMGKSHARISGKRKTPASFHSLINIPVRNSNGEVVKRIVVPRSMTEV